MILNSTKTLQETTCLRKLTNQGKGVEKAQTKEGELTNYMANANLHDQVTRLKLLNRKARKDQFPKHLNRRNIRR